MIQIFLNVKNSSPIATGRTTLGVFVMVVVVMTLLVRFRLFSVEIVNNDFTIIARSFSVAGPGAVIRIGGASGPGTGRLWWFLLVRLVQVVPGLAVRFVEATWSFAARVQSGGRWHGAGRFSAATVAFVVTEAEINVKVISN